MLNMKKTKAVASENSGDSLDRFKLHAKTTVTDLVGGELTESNLRKMEGANMKSALRHKIGDAACKKKLMMTKKKKKKTEKTQAATSKNSGDSPMFDRINLVHATVLGDDKSMFTDLVGRTAHGAELEGGGDEHEIGVVPRDWRRGV